MAFGLKHDPTNSNTYRQGTITMALIISTWPFVLIRIYVRAFMIKAFGADDYMIVAAQIFYTVFCIITFNEIKLVPGAQPSSLEIARKNLHFAFFWGLAYNLCNFALKFSLVFYFLRVLTSRWQRTTAIYLLGFVTIINLYMFCNLLFVCGNPAHYVDNVLQNKCLPRRYKLVTLYLQASVNIIFDLFLMFLPMPSLWSSMMSLGTKISVVFIFVLIGSGTVLSILRLIAITNYYAIGRVTGASGSLFIMYTVMEPGIFIIAACMATMRPLISKPSYVLSKYKSNSSGSGNVCSDTNDENQMELAVTKQ